MPTAFNKNFGHKWTAETFEITRVYFRDGMPIYTLKDYFNKPIIGGFKEHEIAQAVDPKTYKIQSILKRKKVKGKEVVLVQWWLFNKSFNSWIPASSVKSYKHNVTQGDMYLHIDSSQDLNYFTDNTGYSFNVRLPFLLHFNNLFECCIKNIKLAYRSPVRGRFLLNTDFVQESFVYGNEEPVLRSFDVINKPPKRETGVKLFMQEFSESYYIPIVKNTSATIHFDIRGVDNRLERNIERVWLLIHIRERKH